MMPRPDSTRLSTLGPIPFRATLPVSRVPAVPSPAADGAEGMLDLNEHLIRRPASTFFVRVVGDSMIGAGVHDGDLAVVDRSIEARMGHVVVAVLNGEMTVKMLARRGGFTVLEPAKPAYKAIRVTDDADLQIWGVVTAAIHSMCNA
jgi:DNA polymerase V